MHVLFDQGKKLGEVSDWKVIPDEPVYKDVLGKRVLMPAKHDVCSFVSPKPVHRKSQLSIVEDKQTKLVLEVQSVKGTAVTAFVVSRIGI